nr:ubiquitin-like-specific protease 2 [Quercus suber]
MPNIFEQSISHFANTLGLTCATVPEPQIETTPIQNAGDNSLRPQLQDESRDAIDDSEDEIQFLENRPVIAERNFGRKDRDMITETESSIRQHFGGTASTNVAQQNAGEEPTLEGRLKRVQNERHTEEQHSKRQKTTAQRCHPSEHEARLTGKTTVPKDAQRIAIPQGSGSEPNEHKVSMPKSMKPYKFAGSIRPANTLNEQRFTNSGRANPNLMDMPNPRYYGARQADSNVRYNAKMAADGGDEFFLDERKPKRRRLGADEDVADNTTRVLDNDVLEHNGIPILTEGGASSHKKPLMKQNSVALDNLSSFYAHERPKSKHRRRPVLNRQTGVSSSQGSSRDLSFQHEPGVDATNVKMSPGPEIIQISPSPRKISIQQEISGSEELPVIDLGKGVDRPGISSKNIENVHFSPVHQHDSRQRRTDMKWPEQRKDRGILTQRQELTRKQPSNGLPHSTPIGSREQLLSKTFLRDEGPFNTRIRTTATTKIELDQDRSKDRVSPISDDELAGDSTELKRGVTQDRSPAKQNRHMLKKRLSSASDIHPTQFAEEMKSSAPPEPFSQARDDLTRVRVSSFYSKACVMKSETPLWLVWDEHGGTIDLHHDHQPKVYEGKYKVVGLEFKHIRKIDFHGESAKVHIHGTIDELSNGHTCVQFADTEGVQWFINVVHNANENVILKHESPTRMEALFERQSHELQKSHAQYVVRKASSVHPESELGKSREADEIEDEQILYEQSDGDEARRQKASSRSRMETGDIPVLKAPTSSRSKRGFGVEEITRSPFFPPLPQRLTRQTRPAKEVMKLPSPERWTQVNKPKTWSQPIIYPPSGGPNVATVEFRDLKTLDETEFINDSIIAFALRQIQEKMNPEQREQVYFFNSFFYATLTSKNGQQSNCNYDAVKRWTRRADILSKPFIVVPINLDLHWFVAIICNIDQLPRKAASVGDEMIMASETNHSSPVPSDTTPIRPHPGLSSSEPSQDDHHDITNDDQDISMVEEDSRGSKHAQITQNSKSKKAKRKAVPPLRKHATTQPIVITLDSLGTTHPAELRNLKDYIVAEALDKRDISVKRDAILGMNVKDLPEQKNFCDCGLYLVGYMEEFARDPRKFVDSILSRRMMDPESDFAKFNPSKKRSEIRQELLKLNIEQEKVRAAKKRQKSEGNKVKNMRRKSTSADDVIHSLTSEEQPLTSDDLVDAKEGHEPTKVSKEELEEFSPPAGVAEDANLVQLATLPRTDQHYTPAKEADSYHELIIEPAQALEYASPRRKFQISSPDHQEMYLESYAAKDAEVDDTEEQPELPERPTYIIG